MLKTEARKLGAKVAELTPRASFRLIPSMRRPSLRKINYAFRPERFRKPVRRSKVKGIGEVWIEKSKFRIDMPGELKGITLKGLQAPKKSKRRKSKKKRNIWGF